MDERFETELDRDALIALVRELRRELKIAYERIASLEKQVEELSKRSPTKRLDESYSLKAEEERREKQRKTRFLQFDFESTVIVRGWVGVISVWHHAPCGC